MGIFRHDVTPPPGWPPARDAPSAAQAWRYAAQRDPVGHRVHQTLAILAAFSLPLSTAIGAVALAALCVYSVLRIWVTWRGALATLPTLVMVCGGLWMAWTAISLAWSSDLDEGLRQFGATRAILLPILLWPVMDILPMLIGGVLMGVLAQNGLQLAQGMELFGLPTLADGRLGGLLHPIQTGMWCLAALCWHFSSIFADRSAWRWLSMCAVVPAALGLLATGSRGPWLAALIILPIEVTWLLWKYTGSRRQFLLVVLGSAIVAGIALPSTARFWRPRVDAAVNEYHAAIDDGVYWSSVGLRVGLIRWSWSIHREHPILGIGSGSFENAVTELPAFKVAREAAIENGYRDILPDYDEVVSDGQRNIQSLPGYQNAQAQANWYVRYIEVDHPHSTYLDALVRLGIPGALILVLLTFAVLRGCLRRLNDHVYSIGTVAVVFAWIVAGQFDSYGLNGTLFGMLMFAAATTLPVLPPTEKIPKHQDSG